MGAQSEEALQGAARGSSAARCLRVGFLIDRWDPGRGGAEAAMADLARALLARGHDVRAFARDAADGAPGQFERVRPATWSAVPWTRGAREHALARALEDAARHARCDVTIGARHLERVDLYWPHDGACAESWRAQREARGRRSDAAPRGRHAHFQELERALLQGGARAVVCVSRLVREELAGAYPDAAPRLCLIENGVDLARFHPLRREERGSALRRAVELDARTPLVVFAGADGARKGLEAALRALARAHNLEWCLALAGVRHAQRWLGLARTLGLAAGRVRDLGRCEADALWAAADLCLLPTWRDACGLVILESLASGVPVVTTRRAGASDAIRGSFAGSVLDSPSDLAGLERALVHWLSPGVLQRVDRSAVRRCVEGRDARDWLARLVHAVEALA